MKKIILVAVVAVAAIGGAAWLARPQSASLPKAMKASVAVLAASETSFNFGTISMAKGTVSREVRVTNTSASPVTVGKVYTSCMCTSVALAIGENKYGPFGMEGMGYIPRVDDTIAPGKEATLTVVFDPTAHGPAGIGHIERVVTMENDEGQPVTVSFSADVTP